MRGEILFQLYSGNAWIGALAVAIGIAALDIAGVFDDRPVARRGCGVILLLAGPVAALSGTPAPMALWIPSLVAWLTYAFRGFAAPLRARRRILGGIMSVLAASLMTLEARERFRQPAALERPEVLWVLGDSLASGEFGETKRWVDRLETGCGIDVRDMSAPSATTESALEVTLEDFTRGAAASDIVLIELGGNDMLDGRAASEFERDLGEIFRIARGNPANPRVVYFVEFPALPGRWRYAAIQRSLTGRHGVVRIPRHVLARVLTRRGNTFDGLHLSDAGHEALAGEIGRWIGCGPS